tara:strand:+ start:589 stop:774 length:186 start_codon:yes stop_codon:yes gene_type:complete
MGPEKKKKSMKKKWVQVQDEEKIIYIYNSVRKTVMSREGIEESLSLSFILNFQISSPSSSK